MKVLHIIPGLGNGGAEKCLVDLVTKSKTDVHHTIMTCSDEIFYLDTLRKNGIEVKKIDLTPKFKNIINVLRAYFVVRKIKPDIIHGWLYLGNLFGLLFSCASKSQLIWSYHQAHLSYKHNSFKTYIIILFCKYVSQWVNIVHVFVSRLSFAEHQRIGYNLKQYKIISNGVDIDIFKPTLEKGSYSDLRHNNKSDQREFIVGCVSRYDPIKNIPFLLQSFSNFYMKEKKVRLKLIGSQMTEDNQQLKYLISKYQIQDCVELCGPTRNVAEAMRGLDLHVLTSFHEGYGNVIAEALACGVPGVSTITGAAPELLSDNGWLIEGHTPDALAAILATAHEEYSKRPEAWADRRVRSRQKICSQFTISKSVQNYVDLWENYIKK